MHFNMVFPVVMYRCECWAIKKSWVPKDWCVWIVVLEKTLESLLDCKDIKLVNPKGNQPWIFIGKTDAKAKLQYFGHLMWRTDSLEKALILGLIEGRGQEKKGLQRTRWLNCLTDSTDMNLSKLQEIVENRRAWIAAVHGVAKSQTQMSNWTMIHIMYSWREVIWKPVIILKAEICILCYTCDSAYSPVKLHRVH